MTPDEAQQLAPGDKVIMVSDMWTPTTLTPRLGDTGSVIRYYRYVDHICVAWENGYQGYYAPTRLEYIRSAVGCIQLNGIVEAVLDCSVVADGAHWAELWAKKYILPNLQTGPPPVLQPLKVIRIAPHPYCPLSILGLEDQATHQQWVVWPTGVRVIADPATDNTKPDSSHRGMVQGYDGTWSWGFL